MSDPVAMQFVAPVSPEDEARANLYGLLARLYYAPPDAQLLEELRGTPTAPPAEEGTGEEGDAFTHAWAGLLEACAVADPARLEEEHFQLFVGVGKAQVTPYLSAYIVQSERDAPLAQLRGQLAQWGLARRESASEPEDHVAAICETLRWLIVGRKATLDTQRRFFEAYLRIAGSRFCSAVNDCPNAVFYRRVAALLQAFLDIEHKAFEIS
jgi:TorA maturation chaperone TorD